MCQTLAGGILAVGALKAVEEQLSGKLTIPSGGTLCAHVGPLSPLSYGRRRESLVPSHC